MDKLVTVPFGYLLSLLYQWTADYGVAMIIFAIAVKMILLPITAKGKKSSMKMSRLQPRIQEIQRKYANDQQKQNEAMQKLQQEEGASMGMGGCLWSFVPLLILFPLYTVIREPINYMLHTGAEMAGQIVDVIKTADPSLFTGNSFYDQIVAARHIHEFAAELTAAVPGIDPTILEGVKFDFLGIDLGRIPTINIFAADWAWDWAHIGGMLFPALSALTQVLSMKISQAMNNSVITNKDGVQDKETAEKSQTNQTMNTMIWMMPLMSLWFGFTVPAALSLYWFIQGAVSIIQDVILTKHFRKVYDEEDAIRQARAAEEEKLLAEKERIRAERRAANPDGITENTSKKKLQKKLQNEQEAAKAAAKKEYEAKKGIVTEEEKPQKEALSGINDRPNCKGRAYDPNRYRTESTEE